MATKIATDADFGARPSLRSNRPVVDDRSNLIVADALTGAGERATRVGAAMEESNNQFNYQLAKNKAIELQIEIERAVQEIDDFNQWEPEFNSRWSNARDDLVGMLSNPKDQALFDQELDVMGARSSGNIYSAAFRKEVEWGVGQLNDTLMATKEQYLNAGSPGHRAEIMQNALGMINEAQKAGYIGADEASGKRIGAQQEFAISFVGMLERDDRIAMLQKPEGNAAQYIPTDKRKAMLDAALKEDEEERNLTEAQNRVESSYRPGMSLEALIAITTKGTSGKLKEKIKDMAEQQVRLNKVSMDDQYQAIFDVMNTEASAIAAGTKKYGDFVPESVAAGLDASYENMLKDHFDGLAKGESTHKPEVWVGLVRIARDTPGDFVKMNPLAYKPFLSDRHFETLVSMWGNARAGDTSESEALGSYDSIITDHAGGVPERRSDSGREFKTGMWNWILQQKAETGSWPSWSEVNKEAAMRAVTVYIERPAGVGTDELVEVDFMDYGETGRVGEGERKTRDLYPIPAYSLQQNEEFVLDIESLPADARNSTKAIIEKWLGPMDLQSESDEALLEEVFTLVHLTPQFSYYEMPRRIREKIEDSFPEDEPFDRKNTAHLQTVRRIFLSEFRL
jgi:hypothetical protein